MPPKKKPNEPSKKTEQKKKEKIIEVWYYQGLKNGFAFVTRSFV